MIIYGFDAPKKYQLLYVETSKISLSFGGGCSRPLEKLGAISDEGWAVSTCSILESQSGTIQNCHQAWRNRIPLRNSREMERLSTKIKADSNTKCKTQYIKALKQIEKRLDAIDGLLSQAQKEKTLKTRKSLSKNAFREKGGIGVAIDEKGNVIQYNQGHHRLAVAFYLGIKVVPCCIRCVHPLAVKSGHWASLMRLSKQHELKLKLDLF